MRSEKLKPSIPPGFVEYLEAKGLEPLNCMWCKYSIDVERDLACNRFGVYVGVYSSCELFEALPPDVLGEKQVFEEEFKRLWPDGVLDLRK